MNYAAILVSRILIQQAIELALLVWNRQEFVHTFPERLHLGFRLIAFLRHIGGHNLVCYAPAHKIEPTMTFHRKFHAALVADSLLQCRRTELYRSEEHTSELQSL